MLPFPSLHPAPVSLSHGPVPYAVGPGNSRFHKAFTLVPLLLAFVFLLAGYPVAAQSPVGPPAPTVTPHLNTSALIPGQQHVLALVVDIPHGLHAQSATPSSEDYIPTRLTLSSPATPGLKTFDPVYPKGIDQDFPLLGGKLNIYEGRFILYLPVSLDGSVAPGTTVTFSGSVQTQLCNDSTCYPPTNTPFSATVTVAAPASKPTPADPALFADFDWTRFGQAMPAVAPAPTTKTRTAAPQIELFGGVAITLSAWYVTFPLALVVGVIFNVMPCVLPVLPLKAFSFYEAAKHSRARSLFHGAVFSLGMVLLFALLGVLISAFSVTWGQQFQYAWFVYPVALLLIAFATSMWGLFTVNLPAFVYNVDPRSDTIPGNLVFGAFTAILATPCVAPMFPALTLWAAAQPAVIGTLLFVTVGVGMALPYLVLSGFPELARRLPRTGPASEIVKQVMGFFVLATAVWLLGQRLMHGNTGLYLVAATAAAAGLFAIVRAAQLIGTRRAVVVATFFAVLFTAGGFSVAVAANRKTVDWQPYTDTALADLRKQHITLVKFTANWCSNCQVVEQTVFTDKSVKALLRDRDVSLLKVDLTFSGAPGSDLLRTLSPAGGIPLTAVYFPNRPDPVLLTSIYTPADLKATLTSPPAPASPLSQAPSP